MDTPQQRPASRFFFDPQDLETLRIVNDVLRRGQYTGLKRILAPYLHPNGIKQLAAPRGLRIAYAVIHLLSSLELGKAPDRIEALRSLKSEVLMASESTLSINTARVLLQIMKELVRAKDDPQRQLVLAHDFRRAILGKPRIIRSELRKYHLIEVPEDWSQLAFDDHVHDANTKGRKSPSHLIMDAWIKGIRKLTVIYYTIIDPEVAVELLEAAKIMGLSARIGIELRVRHRDRFIKLLWTPRDLADPGDFLAFMNQPGMVEFRRQGQEVLEFQRRYLWDILKKYNASLKEEIGDSLNAALPAISKKGFLDFVGVGQPSIFHLGTMISSLANASRRAAGPAETDAEQAGEIDSEQIIDTWLAPARNPEIFNPFLPHDLSPNAPPDAPSTPELLSLSVPRIIQCIRKLHVKNWITLDPDGLSTDEVLLLLHRSKGDITHLEVFNLRYYAQGRSADYASILELQSVVNSANPVLLKKFVRRTIRGIQDAQDPAGKQLLDELRELLDDLSRFHELYKNRPLRLRIGTDSTGQSSQRHGMGLVAAETLPGKAQRMLRRSDPRRHLTLPVAMDATAEVVFALRPPRGLARPFSGLFRLLPGCFAGCVAPNGKPRITWKRGGYRLARGKGNIYTLGGLQAQAQAQEDAAPSSAGRFNPWTNLNSNLKNLIKIFLGFVPAALSFYFTKNWWLLAYFGPVIWFGITGLRNIIQSVLACGGFQRSSLLKWNDFVSWGRFSDSLLFTGFSVPLLDYLVKAVLLDRYLGITTTTNPILLYTIMALVNGAYISTHNTLRGLPRRAVVGNFFRSVLSIPLAILYNLAIGSILGAYGVGNVDAVLQKWAAIISKCASDCVAGVIEGMADRATYIRLRTRDLRVKMNQLYETYAKLEVLFPQEDVLELLESPKAFIETISTEQKDLEQVVIVNALDMLYFWMYQPQARTVLRRMLRDMDQDERKAFLLSQYVLQREKEISQLLVNGLLGRKFGNALAFYLNTHENYLEQVQHVASSP